MPSTMTSATASPVSTSVVASGETVEDDLAFVNVGVEPEAGPDALAATDAATLPLGSSWRASRLFDPSKEPLPESPAVMRVVVVNQLGDSSLGAGYKVVPDYSKFFLQGISEQDMEKAHIVETFGSYWVRLFGRKPRVFSFSGMLLSAPGENWEAAWDMLYDRYLRGTRCVEMGTQAQMTYGGKSVYGYVLGYSKDINAVNENGVGFNFSMLVTHIEWLAKDQILRAQFGVDGIDGLVALGDLKSFSEVSAEVASRDIAAGEAAASILNGEWPADATVPEDYQTGYLASALSDMA